MNFIYKLSLVLMWVFNIGDACTTWYALTKLGGHEMNPAMGWVIDRGWFWFFLVKLIGGGVISYFWWISLIRIKSKRSISPYINMAFIDLMLGYAAIGNLFKILISKGIL